MNSTLSLAEQAMLAFWHDYVRSYSPHLRRYDPAVHTLNRTRLFYLMTEDMIAYLKQCGISNYANWATCVKACKGKYICNCDNDDYWHNPNKLQLQLDYMESHPKSNICITNHREYNRTTGELKEREAEIDRSVDIQTAMWHSGHFCNATIMYRADFMKAHLDLDEFIRRRFTLQDWPAWVILTAYTDIDVLPESTATWCMETVSITGRIR